jgi:hypothetical protein
VRRPARPRSLTGVSGWEGSVGLGARPSVGAVAEADPSAPPRAVATDVRRASSLTYNPAFDGLRGVAVAAVLAFHGGFSWARAATSACRRSSRSLAS